MTNRIEPRPAILLLVATGAGAASYIIWDRLFLAFQHWYFHRYVEPLDPHPPFLPFTWYSFWLLPLLSALTAGVTAGALFRRGNKWLPSSVGLCIGVACLALFGFYTSTYVALVALGVTVVGSAAYYLAQLVHPRPGPAPGSARNHATPHS